MVPITRARQLRIGWLTSAKWPNRETPCLVVWHELPEHRTQVKSLWGWRIPCGIYRYEPKSFEKLALDQRYCIRLEWRGNLVWSWCSVLHWNGLQLTSGLTQSKLKRRCKWHWPLKTGVTGGCTVLSWVISYDLVSWTKWIWCDRLFKIVFLCCIWIVVDCSLKSALVSMLRPFLFSAGARLMNKAWNWCQDVISRFCLLGKHSLSRPVKNYSAIFDCFLFACFWRLKLWFALVDGFFYGAISNQFGYGRLSICFRVSTAGIYEWGLSLTDCWCVWDLFGTLKNHLGLRCLITPLGLYVTGHGRRLCSA